MDTFNISSRLYRSLRGIFCVYKPANISTRGLINSLKFIISKELGKYPLNERQATVMRQHRLTSASATQSEMISNPTHTNQCTGAETHRLLQHKERTHTTNITQEQNVIPASNYPSFMQRTDIYDVDDDNSEHEYLGEVTRIERENSPLNMDADDVQVHPLVLGNLWRPDDIVLVPMDTLSVLTSGVLPFSIGQSRKILDNIRQSNPIKVYRLTATLGVATDNYLEHGRVLEKARYEHVTQAMVDRVLAGIQATFLRLQFAMAGVDIQSQEAYEMASQGLLRPDFNTSGKRAVVYSIKSVHFAPPELIIEIHTINETGRSLAKLIHDLGVELRCGAVCTKLRRIRFGRFDISHSLTNGQWNCDDILNNFDVCRPATATSLLDRVDQMRVLAETKSKVIPSSNIDTLKGG